MDASKLMFKPGLMASERILVTGGGTGLGREMTEAFVKLGAEVYICGRRGEVLQQTADEIMAAHGGKVWGIPCDIRDAQAVHAMVDQIWASGGPLTGLMNNAAGNFISRTEDLSAKGFDAISNIVFRGSFYVTHDIGKRWIAEGRKGNVCSILVTWIWHGGPFTVPSAMAKAGLDAMTKSLAVEWGRYGIRFNAIAPGAFPTKGAWERLAPGADAEVEKKRAAEGPSIHGRVGRIEELCNLAVLLLAPGADFINGQTIAIDGGEHLLSEGGFYDRFAAWGDAEWQAARETIRSADEKDRAKRTK